MAPTAEMDHPLSPHPLAYVYHDSPHHDSGVHLVTVWPAPHSPEPCLSQGMLDHTLHHGVVELTLVNSVHNHPWVLEQVGCPCNPPAGLQHMRRLLMNMLALCHTVGHQRTAAAVQELA